MSARVGCDRTASRSIVTQSLSTTHNPGARFASRGFWAQRYIPRLGASRRDRPRGPPPDPGGVVDKSPEHYRGNAGVASALARDRKSRWRDPGPKATGERGAQCVLHAANFFRGGRMSGRQGQERRTQRPARAGARGEPGGRGGCRASTSGLSSGKAHRQT
jgi:hypothetical protein